MFGSSITLMFDYLFELKTINFYFNLKSIIDKKNNLTKTSNMLKSIIHL